MVLILKYVFLGIIFYTILIPVLEQIAVVICQSLEYVKGLILLKTTQIQLQIDNLAKEETDSSEVISAVGFTIPSEQEEYYEEEDEE